MYPRLRLVRTSVLPLLCLVAVVALGLAVTPAAAQSDQPQGQGVQPQAADDDVTRRERKEAAKQKRIDDYLRKREERRAEKEKAQQERQAKAAEDEARKIEAEQIAAQQEEEAMARKARQAATPKPAPEPVATMATPKKKGRTGGKPSKLPRGLARAQSNIRATELALDPTVQEYLNLIDAQGASAHQLAAFANFIAQNGMVRDAQEYYAVALKLEPRDAVLWVNSGTLQMQTKNHNAAINSFSRALAINPNNAVAHYNLGATLDQMNRYEDAVAAYKTALTLDPTLGDPVENPQAANNNLLLAVKLMLYQEQAGSLSHPLLDITIRDASDDSQGR